MQAVISFVTTHYAILVTILFLLSELIGEIPSLKSNSVFGLIRDLLKGEYKKESQDLAKALEKK